MLENFQGDSWGSIPPLHIPSLLPHDLCHGQSSSRWLPAGESVGKLRIWKWILISLSVSPNQEPVYPNLKTAVPKAVRAHRDAITLGEAECAWVPFRQTACHSMSCSMQRLLSLTESENSLLRQESLSLFCKWDAVVKGSSSHRAPKLGFRPRRWVYRAWAV